MSEQCPYDECECGDYRHQHTGPDNRGSCRICRDGAPPPDGPDGCQRFRPGFPAHGPDSRDARKARA